MPRSELEANSSSANDAIGMKNQTLCFYFNSVDEIDQHVFQLKKRRNALLPVAKLPAEIMQRIFLLLARPRPLLENPWESKRKRWDWLRLTVVCRSWRELALGCAPLWAEIKPSFDRNKAEIFLERSAQADLTVEVGGYFKHDRIHPGVLELIGQHMHRVREIRIVTGEEIAQWNTIQDMFEAGVPRLRVLHLIAQSRTLDDDHAPSMHLDKLARSLPVRSLDEVSLRAIVLPWSSRIFHGLSSLSLEYIEASYRPTVDELLAILAASPNLQILNLYNAGPRHSEKLQRKIALPRLTKIEITKIDFKVLVALFEDLTFPTDIGWTIEDVLNPFTGFSSFPPNLLKCSVACNHLTLGLDNCSLTIEPMFGIYSDEAPELSLQVNDEHTHTLPNGIISFFQSLEKFFRHPFFSNVTNLVVEMAHLSDHVKIQSLTSVAWAHLFAAFSKMEKLEIYFTGEKNTGLESQLITALIEPESESGENSTSTSVSVCSKLRTLEFTCGVFLAGDGREAYEKLLSSLVLRRQSGKRLNMLEFRKCLGVGAEQLQRMKDLDVAKWIQL